MAMLEGEDALTLEVLNQATQAWVEQEYHRTHHAEIGDTPLARYLAGPNVARPCPDSAELRAAFRIEITRRQRRSDGTVSLAGRRFEIPARFSPPRAGIGSLRALGSHPRRSHRCAHRRRPVRSDAAG